MAAESEPNAMSHFSAVENCTKLKNAPRMDVIERYFRIGYDQDVLLIQNPGMINTRSTSCRSPPLSVRAGCAR